MKISVLYILWGILYLVCAVLGVVSLPGWVGILGCLLFFLPPAVILHRAVKAEDRRNIARVRNICLIWLGVTVLMLILNIASVGMSATAGQVLYYLMAVLCAPLVCGRFWILSLFLFACLLMAAVQKLRKK